jgi:hypothetical protein
MDALRGLIASWAKDARVETVDTAPSYRQAFKKTPMPDNKGIQVDRELDIEILKGKRKKREPRMIILDSNGTLFVLEPEQICGQASN